MSDMRRYQIPTIIVSIFLLVSCGGETALPATPEPDSTLTALVSPEPAPEFLVIGYFPDYRELNPAWAEHLTDLIYFSAQPRADGTLDTSLLMDETWLALAPLQERGLRVHLTVGGWERGDDFAAMTADPQTRQTFVMNLLGFALAHHLSGVDFDWEFPQNNTEFENYIELLKEVKTAFSQHGLIVSVALPAESIFPLGGFAAADRVHIMSYDRGERHATFEQAVTDVQTFLDAGIPPEKLILGLPFYGREVAAFDHSFTYAEIMAAYSPAPDVDEVNGIYFNGLGTIRRKVCDGLEKGLGGFMIWELAQDTNDAASLLALIFQLAKGIQTC